MRPRPPLAQWVLPVAALALLAATATAGTASSVPASSPPALSQRLERLPLVFEPNIGQTDPAVAFLARGSGYTLFLTGGEIALSLPPGASGAVPAGAALSLRLLGASGRPAAEGAEPLPGKVNYYVGRDPSGWREGVPTYGRVRFHEVWPGIDVEFYGNQGELEHDFVVEPGADPSRIVVAIDGAECVELRGDGALVADAGGSEVMLRPPQVYQLDGGARREIPGAYRLLAGGVAVLALGDYDPAWPLVIDPLTLVYSSYLGGSANDSLTDMAADPAGNLYLTGLAGSRNFPVANAAYPDKPQPANVGCGVVDYPPPHCYYCTMDPCWDAFVTKVAPDGASLVYSTYLGGTSDDRAYAITADAAGNAYVTGRTYSDDFPRLNALPDKNPTDAFVTRLGPTGALTLSTYFGGSGHDEGRGIVLDRDGNVLLVGKTVSGTFPTTPGVFSPSTSFTMCDTGTPWVHECTRGFVAKLDLATPSVLWASLVGPGGKVDADVSAVATDAAGNAYVLASGDLYKVEPGGTAIIYQRSAVGASEVAVDPAGAAYLAGFSTTLATTPGALDNSCAGGDAFVAKVTPDGAGLAWATCLGGSGTDDSAYDIAVSPAGQITVAGRTSSADFPTTPGAVDTTAAGQEGFVARLGASGQRLLFSTLLGGGADEWATAVALLPGGDTAVAGTTYSTDFPTAAPFQGANGAPGDAFFARIAQQGCWLDCAPNVPAAARLNDPVALDVDVLSGGCTGAATFEWHFGDGSAPALIESPSHTYTAAGSYPWQVTVTLDGQVCTASGTIEVGCRVSCDAQVPGFARVGDAVAFVGSSQAPTCWDPVATTWGYGDGSPAGAGTSTTHAYAAPGTYPWQMAATADGVECVKNGTIAVFAPPVVFADGFEGEFPGPWQTAGTPWQATDQLAFNGSRSASTSIGSSGTSRMAFGPFSLADVAAARLTFAYQASGSCTSFYVKASTNGTDFTTSTSTLSQTWDGWGVQTVDLAQLGGGALLGQPQVWVAFHFESWFNPACGGQASVDEVRVEAAPAAPGCRLSCHALVPGTVQARSDAKLTALPWSLGCPGSTSVSWDYGDGSPAGTWTPITHKYATTGDYNWTMTATQGGQTCQSGGAIHVDPPPPCEPQCGAWTDPGSEAIVGEAVTFISTLEQGYCEPPATRDWDFGDGSAHSAETSPSHAFAAPGTYTWTVTITIDGKTCTKTGTITINPRPPCSIECSATVPPTAVAGDGVAFAATVTTQYCTAPVVIDWDHGDGSAHSDLEDHTHAYAQAGTHPWRLLVTVEGASCERTGSITVSPRPPCALTCGATVPGQAGTGENVAFAGDVQTAYCDGGAPAISWAHGDLAPVAAGANVTHAYANAGSYGWTMLAELDGAACTSSGTVEVGATDTVTILQDGFEGPFPGSWEVAPATGTAWGASTHRANGGTRSAYCAGGGTAPAPAGGPYPANLWTWLTYGPFSLADATAAEATFSYWLNGEPCCDVFAFGASTDGETFDMFTTAATTDGWQGRTLDLATLGVVGSPQVWLGFLFDANFSVQGEGGYVDDVLIRKTVAGGGGCTATCSATAPASVMEASAATFTGTAAFPGCSPAPPAAVAAAAALRSASPAGRVGALLANGPPWLWRFGEGTAAGSGQEVQHTYTAAGRFLWQGAATSGTTVCGRSGAIRVDPLPRKTVKRHLRR